MWTRQALSGRKPLAGKGVESLLSWHRSNFHVCITFCVRCNKMTVSQNQIILIIIYSQACVYHWLLTKLQWNAWSVNQFIVIISKLDKCNIKINDDQFCLDLDLDLALFGKSVKMEQWVEKQGIPKWKWSKRVVVGKQLSYQW